MAIAANYRKFPEALEMQLVLPFGKLLRWALGRPSTRLLRAIRAERGRAFAKLGRTQPIVKKSTPQWVKDAAARAKAFAAFARTAQLGLDIREIVSAKGVNPFRLRILKGLAERGQIILAM